MGFRAAMALALLGGCIDFSPSGAAGDGDGDAGDLDAPIDTTWRQHLPGVVVADVAADVAHQGIYLAAGAGEGTGCDGADKVNGCDVYFTSDSGGLWQSVTEEINRLDVRAVAINDLIGIAVSRATDNGQNMGPEKILRTGTGLSWELALNGVAEDSDKVAAIDPNDQARAFVANVSLPPAAGQSRTLTTNTGGAACRRPRIMTSSTSARRSACWWRPAPGSIDRSIAAPASASSATAWTSRSRRSRSVPPGSPWRRPPTAFSR